MKIQFKSSEVLILLAAAVMSILANLPDDFLGNLIDRRSLLAGLAALIVVAMFRYLQMMLLLTISILAIGANLPEEFAATLGISKLALLVSLAALIVIGLLNRTVKLFPTGKETPPDIDTPDIHQSILEAIAKGDQATLQLLLAMNVSVNFTHNGTTPLHLATEKGYPDIVRKLISHGADIRVKNAEGLTPLEVALAKKKFVQTTEILHSANKSLLHEHSQVENR